MQRVTINSVFILRPCQQDDGYIDGRSHIKVHTDERTLLGSQRSVFADGHQSCVSVLPWDLRVLLDALLSSNESFIHSSKCKPRSTLLNFIERATGLALVAAGSISIQRHQQQCFDTRPATGSLKRGIKCRNVESVLR